MRFWIHPGSVWEGRPGRWVMAAELTETTRLYARLRRHRRARVLESVARIWSAASVRAALGEAAACCRRVRARDALRLLLYAKRRVHYGPLPGQIEGKYSSARRWSKATTTRGAPFFLHNRRLLQEIEQLEHKSLPAVRAAWTTS